MLEYDGLFPAPLDDASLTFMVEKVREVAWPRIHVQIEAESRRELGRKLDALNVELRARSCPALEIGTFSRGERDS